MAQYIEADKLKEECRYYDTEDDLERYVKMHGYANVVPIDYDLYKIKSDLAREIFEEIYKSVASKIPMEFRPIFKDDRDFDGGFINGKRDALLDVLVLVAELKKKYTEDNNDG